MCRFWFPGVGLVGGGVVLFTACVNLMYVGQPAVMVSAILAARQRTFCTGCYITICIVFFPMHNKFLLLLLLTMTVSGEKILTVHFSKMNPVVSIT